MTTESRLRFLIYILHDKETIEKCVNKKCTKKNYRENDCLEYLPFGYSTN